MTVFDSQGFFLSLTEPLDVIAMGKYDKNGIEDCTYCAVQGILIPQQAKYQGNNGKKCGADD